VAPSRVELRRGAQWNVAELLRADSVTAGIVILLALAWCVEGALALARLPQRLDVFVDLGAALLCVWLAVRLVRTRTVPRVPLVVWAYVLWVLAGLYTHAPAGAAVTSARNFVLLPVLALLLATEGTSERRVRFTLVTLFGLAVLQFVLMVEQAMRFGDVDQVSGSFGASANAATAAAMLIVICVAASGYLVRAPGDKLALAAAAVFPLFSAWAVVKIVPLLVPAAVVVTAIGALAVRRTSWRRALTVMAAVTASAGLVISWYAAFRPDSFQALFNADARANYVRNASINRNSSFAPTPDERPARGKFANLVDDPSAEIDTAGMSSYVNAVISRAAVAYSGRGSFRIADAAPGDYTAQLTNYDGTRIAVKENVPYTFSAYVRAATRSSEAVTVQIEWRDSNGRIVGTTLGTSTTAPGRYRRLVASGKAPTRAVTATPKIAVTHVPDAASAIYADALQFERGTKVTPYVERPENSRRRSILVPRPFPGRLTQWRMAEREISTSPTKRLFGEGLGSATVAVNLGVSPEDLSANAAAASYSDFGTLLVERGWTGVALVGLIAVILGVTALRIARTLPGRLWTTALTLAVPGVLCVMAAYGMIASQLRNAAVALTFWVVIALGLSPGSFLGRARDVRRESTDSVATAPHIERNDDRLQVMRRKTN